MIIIEVKDGENIDRALKRYKRKHRNIKLMDEIRSRQHYTKKSKIRRETIKKAEYKQKYLRMLED